MGRYLNPGTTLFQESLNSAIYVDKSGLIAKTNRCIYSMQKYVCVSRPRRFGKSAALAMLSAYYAYGQDSRALFAGQCIAEDASFEKHLNQYNVLKINMQFFLSMTDSIEELLELLQGELLRELKDAYGTDRTRLPLAMGDVYAKTCRGFVILIDEWDCLFREYRENKEAQTKYLDFLRMWLKDQDYVALAYMTGILPIKKYGTHSALNMFTEYSMTNPQSLAPFFGFTEQEVRALCDAYRMNFEEARAWYDGYALLEVTAAGETVTYSMYNPKAVVEAMLSHKYDTYWNQTETYEALKVYIQMNIDGLKDAVINMLAGKEVPVDVSGFENDMTTFTCADDVLTLLIHLGYLSYHEKNKTVSIPNKEVTQVYITSIRRMQSWHEVARSVEASRRLLTALWERDGETVAAGIDRAHDEISILQYNDENSLSCTVHLAFYYAREYYNIIRELPAGKGFADICLVPRPLHMDKPAVIIELKWDKDVNGAIAQIKEKQYVNALKDYSGSLLLAGINYDKDTKKHSCIIEQMQL